MRKLLSDGRWTWRSSPKNRCILSKGPASAAWIVDQQAVECFGVDPLPALRWKEPFSRTPDTALERTPAPAPCDGRSVRQDANLTIHTRSSQVMIPLYRSALRPRLSISSSRCAATSARSSSNKSSASMGPQELPHRSGNHGRQACQTSRIG